MSVRANSNNMLNAQPAANCIGADTSSNNRTTNNHTLALLADLRYWLPKVIVAFLLLMVVKATINPSGGIAWDQLTSWYLVATLGIHLGVAAMVIAIGYSRFVPKTLSWLGVVLGMGIYLVLGLMSGDNAYDDPAINLMVILSPLAVLVPCCLGWLYLTKGADYSDGTSTVKQVLWLFVALIAFIAFLGKSTVAALDIITVIYPNVYDIVVYKLDAAFFDARHHFVMWHQSMPAWFLLMVDMVYASLFYATFSVMALMMREKKGASYHMIRTNVIIYALGFFCYSVIPISGPIYTFDINDFFGQMPDPSLFDTGVGFIPPNPRNGMPSMHYTGAFLVLMFASVLSWRGYFYGALVFWLLTIVATIGTGEHYILDLIVAAPFAISVGLLLISPAGWRNSKSMVVACYLALATFVFWMLSILTMSAWLANNIWFVRLLSVWSVAIAGYLSVRYFRWVWSKEHQAHLTQLQLCQAKQSSLRNVRVSGDKGYAWIIGVFVASGFAGLLYEVVYAKSLAITFGSTSLASYTVLVTYMGGMALGAWLGGILADRAKNPLIYYIGIEALIGVYAVATPFLFKLVQSVYLSIATGMPPDAQILTGVRVSLGALVLGIPTVLMGMTVPFMFKYLKYIGTATEQAIGNLYSANVVGAAFGSMIGAYVLLPALGRNGATNLAAVISLLIALYALDKSKSISLGSLSLNTTEKIKPRLSPKMLGFCALMVLLIGGGITLGLEVVSIHMLAVVAGNSVYAFGLMLTTFLAGLAVGSMVGKKALTYLSCAQVMMVAWCGVSACIVITALFWDELPNYFASFGYMQQYIHINFWAREIIRGFVCAIAMFPAAFFIGVNYPAAMSLASDFLIHKGEAKSIGIASAVNTFGNIAGVLIIAFFALPYYGSNRLFWILALLSLMLATMTWLADNKSSSSPKPSSPAQAGLFVVIMTSLALLSFYPKQWDLNSLSQGSNVYFDNTFWGEIIDHTESVSGGITAVASNPNNPKELTLLTNGKFQGNNTGETDAQESVALIPLMHTNQRDNALVIGYGTGMTARVFYDQHFKQIDVAELAKDIVVMADRYFGSINHNISQQDNVNMYYTDGRNYLLTQDKKYDVISIEISSIWFAGAANLYNKEFYQLTKKRLTDDGILQQWIQLHHIYPQDLVHVLNTVRSEFDYVWLYVSGGQGIIVASNSHQAHNLNPLIMPYYGKTQSELTQLTQELKKGMILSPEGVNALAKKTDPTLRHIISTDNNLYLEYATPKGNSIAYDSFMPNLEFLSQFEPQHSSAE